MTAKRPRIASLHPIVLADNRRVTLELVVENLPAAFANVMLAMPDMPASSAPRPPRADPNAPSPYPNIELSILNRHRQQIASLFIVEHQEKHTSLTLHLTAPDVNEAYIARAEMIYNEETLDVVEVPFSLHQVK